MLLTFVKLIVKGRNKAEFDEPFTKFIGPRKCPQGVDF